MNVSVFVFVSVLPSSQVGSYFVGQYYQVLRQQPSLIHQFYSDSSTMIRVDGDSTETAPDVLVIIATTMPTLTYYALILCYYVNVFV